MSLRFRRASPGALALGALLASAGCATANRIPLGEEDAQRLETVRSVAVLAQQELKAGVLPSRRGPVPAMGLAGVLFAMAANHADAQTADAKAAPVRAALVGWDAAGALRAALEREVAPVAVLRASPIEVRQVPNAEEARAALFKETREDALFLVEADYRLSPTFDRLVITVSASLLPTRVAPTATDNAVAGETLLPEPLYANVFVSSTALPGFVAGDTTRDEAAAMWAADGGPASRRALEDGMNEVARMIAFDIAEVRAAKTPTTTYVSPEGASSLTSVGPYAAGTLSGFSVRTDQGRAWLRVASGELAAVEAP